MAKCEHEVGFCVADCQKDGTPQCPFYDEDDFYRDQYGVGCQVARDGQIKMEV